MQRKKSSVNYKYVKYTFMMPEKKRLKYWTKYAIVPSMYEYRRYFIAGKFLGPVHMAGGVRSPA